MRARLSEILVYAVVAAVVFAGYRALWFLTDDAFIAFRYVSNAVEGHGLVWNPPPFAPVEGYTSFLWVALLAAVWQVTGVAPPESANVISFLFGCGTLVLVARWIRRMPLPERLARRRWVLEALVLLGVVTNRTFLTWLSSGLETALFGFCFTWWLYEVFAQPGARSGLRLSLAAALAALARPDGLLLAAGAAAILALDAWQRERTPARTLVAATPLLMVPAHLLFRFATYGAWLPNTYAAKYLGPWPESGWRYAASFALENGLWLWLLLVAFWLTVGRPSTAEPAEGGGAVDDRRRKPPVNGLARPFIALAVVAGHAGYYTFAIGGDHFEYRVYAHLVPLFALSALAILAGLRCSAWVAALSLAALAVAAWPIAWVHWAQTKDLEKRRETHVLVRPIAQDFPPPLRSVVAYWDGWQEWLIRRHVGMRHQEHKVFCEFRRKTLPTREVGSQLSFEDRPVVAAPAVGVLAWVLPEVAVIDLFGLNDRVVARMPPAEGDERLMAHARRPPEGYVACFRPNVVVAPRVFEVREREPPLTDDEIRACEERAWSAR